MLLGWTKRWDMELSPAAAERAAGGADDAAVPRPVGPTNVGRHHHNGRAKYFGAYSVTAVSHDWNCSPRPSPAGRTAAAAAPTGCARRLTPKMTPTERYVRPLYRVFQREQETNLQPNLQHCWTDNYFHTGHIRCVKYF